MASVALIAVDSAVAVAGVTASAPKPRAEGWTPSSHWVANDDGTVTRTLYPGLTFHTDADGKWVPIDPTVVPTRDEKSPDVAAVPGAVRPVIFGRDASRLMEIRLDRGTVTLSAPGLKLDPPTVGADGVSYVAPAAHAVVGFTVGVSGVKQETTLYDRTSPTAYRFHLSDPAGVLGTPVAQHDGGYVFDKPVADGLHLSIPAPVAYEQGRAPSVQRDKDGNVVPSARLRIARRGDGFDIVESVNPVWLAGKSFPIVLDPSLTYRGATRVVDCTVNGAPGSLTTASCGNTFSDIGADATGARRMLVRYDTSGFPSPAQVTGASVVLTPTTGGSAVSAELREAGAAWTTGATWVTSDGSTAWPVGTVGGAPKATLLGSGTISPGGSAVSFSSADLTTLVANWINGSAPNNGLVVKAANETAPGPGFAKVSTTEASTTTQQPALEITYISPPDPPGSLTATRGDQSASLTWTTPANNGAAITGYTIEAYTGGTLVSTTPASAGATGATVTGLTNGTPYTFKVFASNAIGPGERATSNEVTPAGVPFAPTNVSAIRGDQSATVTWTAAGANGDAVTGNAVKAYIGGTLVSTTNVGAVTSTTVTGLTNGTSYTFKVAATNTVGTGPLSAASNAVTPAGVPFAPTGVSAVPGNGSASVTWTAANGNGSAVTANTVSAYQGSTLVTTAEVGAVTAATVSGLVNGTTYTFKVAARNDVGTGAQSVASNAVVAGTPGTPTGVTATRGDQSASVSWTAPAQNGAPITGYAIKAYTGSTLVSTTNAGTATSGTVTGLTNGTPYTFRVTASNTYGSGLESAASNSVTPAGVPFAPTNVSATAGDTQATVSWTAPGANGSAITGFTIKAYDGGTLVSTTTAAANATSKVVTGLTNGTAYSFTVAATNDVGTGAVGTSNVVTPAGVPFAPTNVNATAGDTSLTVTWTAANANGSALTGYTVKTYQGTTLVSTTTAAAGATSKTVTGLTNGTGYYATVAATNAVGTGPAATSNTVTPAGLPFAPANVTATRGDGSAVVTWNPADGNGATVTSYTVKAYSGTTLVTSKSATGTSTTVTGLTNGTSYTFKVEATNSVGTGPQSAASNAVTPAGTPLAPSGVSAARADQAATVSWAAPSGNGAPITGYVVRAYEGSTLVTTKNVGAVTSTSVTGLTNGHTYTFTVAATNDVGTGPESAASNTVTPAGVPFVPAIGLAEPRTAAGYVEWATPGDNGAPITSYTITAYAGGTAVQTAAVSGTATSGTVTGLTNGTSYTFTVKAINAVGTGGESGHSAAVSAGAPGRPANVTAVEGDRSATVSWTAAPQHAGAITGYQVKVYRNGTYVNTFPGTTATSVVVTSLTNRESYTFRVFATNAYGNGPDSDPSSAVTPVGPPLAPSNVTATAGDQSATVTWSHADDNGSPITGYTVGAWVGATLFSSTSASATATSAVVTGLTNGTSYTFTVTGINARGTGTSSAPSAAVVPAGVPLAPASVTAVAGDTTLTVTWSAASPNGAALTSYRLSVQNVTKNTTQAPIEVDAGTTATTLTGLTNGTQYRVSVAGVNRVGTGAGTTSASATPAAATVPASSGQFVPLTPKRIVDTRSGLGGSTTPLTGGATQAFTLTGVAGVPEEGVSAVAISVAGIAPTANSYITVWPTGKPRPQVSQVTLPSGQTTAGLVIAKLGEYGQANFFTNTGSMDVLVDVQGYYTDNTSTTGAARYAALTPARIVDTRTGLGNGTFGTTPVGAQESRPFTVTGVAGIPSTGVESVAFSITATQPTASGYLTVYRNGDPRPGTSNLNPAVGQTVTALVEAQVDGDGKVAVYNASGTTHVLIDIQGYYTRATGTGPRIFVPVDPDRIYNTTNGLNTGSSGTTPLASNETRSVLIAGARNGNQTEIVPASAVAAVLSVQAVAPTNPGWLQGYPAGESRPNPGSFLNYGNTYSYTATFIAKVGTNGYVNFFASTGSLGLVVDVMGYFVTSTTFAPFPPSIASTTFPSNAWAGAGVTETTSGTFDISTSSFSTERFLYSLDDPSMSAPASVNVTNTFGDASITLTPGGGWHTLYVAGVNKDGLVGSVAEYSFGGGTPGITSPAKNAHVDGVVPLTARAKAGYVGVTWQYRRGGAEPWLSIPVADVTNEGAAVTAWPVTTTSSGIDTVIPNLTWDAAKTLGLDGTAEVRTCLRPSSGSDVCSVGGSVILDRSGDTSPTATTDFNTGTLNLVSGNVTLNATDVSVETFASDLSVSRSLNTGAPVRTMPGAHGLLTENQADVESSTTGFTGVNATVSRTSTRAYSQTYALQVAPAPSGPSNETYAHVGGDAGGMRLGLQAGRSYTLTTHVYVPSTTGLPGATHSIRAQRAVAFWKVNGLVSEAATPAPTATNTWQRRAVRFTVPLGATEAYVRLYNGGPTADIGGSTTKYVTFDKTSLTEEGVFGPGWVPSLPVNAANSTYAGLTDLGVQVHLHEADGSAIVFTRNAAGFFKPTGDDRTSGLTLKPETITNGSAATWTLTDINGVSTVFVPSTSYTTPPTTSGPHAYRVDRVTQPGSALTTTYTYTSGRVTEMLAPVPASATCTSTIWTKGCRALRFTYNDYGHLAKVTFRTTTSTGAALEVAMSCYSYDEGLGTGNSGRLLQQWDPRMVSSGGPSANCGSPVRPIGYGYDTSGRLTSITPAGQAAVVIGYNATTGRVESWTRTHSGGGSEQATVVYGVSTAPDPSFAYYRPDMTRTSVARWGQTDVPATAIAIFPPGTTPSATDLRGASVYYLSAGGRIVNTASFSGASLTDANGWRRDYSAYNASGDIVQTLSEENLELALNPSTAPPGLTLPSDTAAAAAALSTVNIYSLDGMDLLDTFGPYHLARIPDGTTVGVRGHTRYTYDNGSELAHPFGEKLHLEVSRYTASSRSTAAFPTNEVDRLTTVTQYALSASDADGWKFRKPMQVIEDPAGLALSAVTRYDPNTGQTIETRMPSNLTGGGAGSTYHYYYTSDGSSPDAACRNRPEWANLLCKKVPAAQPAADAATAGLTGRATVHVEGYDYLNRPTSVTESTPGGGTRTTQETYENGGYSPRIVQHQITGNRGVAVPVRTIAYDAANGLPVTISAAATAENPASTISIGYDDFGRVVSYNDGSGATATTTTYDGSGRVSTVTDAKGARTYGYNAGGERRGLATSLEVPGVGTFTATYASDGALETQTWPNGVVQRMTYDQAGQLVGLSMKLGSTVWLDETVARDGHGQVLSRAATIGAASGSPGGAWTYAYDAASRLTSVTDDPSNAACATRTYTYDANSNRLSSSAFPGGTGGACQSSTGGVTTAHRYDTADRLLGYGVDAGLAYDALGRITTLPGTATSPAGSAVTAEYYVDDLVYRLTQGSASQTWTLDASGRRATRTDRTGITVTGTVTNHYNGASDVPSWIAENSAGTAWTRNVTSLDGSLTATVNEAGTVTWLVKNLHGDVVAVATGSAGQPSAGFATDEFGVPQGATAGRYGWLGAHQRATDTPGGLVLMGVRLYVPALGRFLQVDPVDGGSANAYEYAAQDPVNQTDISGRAVDRGNGGGSTRCTCTPQTKRWKTGSHSFWGTPTPWVNVDSPDGNLFRKGFHYILQFGSWLATKSLVFSDYGFRLRRKYRTVSRCNDGWMEYNIMAVKIQYQTRARIQLMAGPWTLKEWKIKSGWYTFDLLYDPGPNAYMPR